jgi:hypothetical protein
MAEPLRLALLELIDLLEALVGMKLSHSFFQK